MVASLLQLIWQFYTIVTILTFGDNYFSMVALLDLRIASNVVFMIFNLKRMLFLTSLVHCFNSKVPTK